MSIIIPNGTGGGAAVGGLDLGHSHIGWFNVINDNTVSSATDAANLGYLYDNMTTLYWNAGVGTVDVDINLLSPFNVNWCGIANGNWQSAGTTIEIYVGSDTNKVGEVSGLRDTDPFMWQFDDIETTFIRFRFISSGDLKIGEIGAGQTIKFPCLPNIGLELAKFNNNDKIYGKMTDDDIFAGTTVLKRSRVTRATYQFVPIDWVRLYWVLFSDTHKGKLVWFMWDSVGAPNDISFGHWSAPNFGYTKSTFSAITFSVMGDHR